MSASGHPMTALTAEGRPARAVPEVLLASRRWAQAGGTQAQGYAHLDGRFLDAGALASALDACANEDAWVATVRRLNGCFAVVTRRAGGVLAAVDRVRSIPLFTGPTDAPGCVADDAHAVAARLGGPAIDAQCATEFELTGYVTGAQTLHPRVRQLEAGTWVRLADGAEARRYHAFAHGDFRTEPVPDLVDQLEALHQRVFRRLLDGAQERPIVVPLSGGYDSRLIGVSLRDLGARDVLCYSYGVPGNWESRISQELAGYLGFRWAFVPYDAQRWRAWAESPEYVEYFRRAGQLASVPHVQDWPAIRELERDGRLPRDAIVVPGHSGDFLAGSHIPQAFVKRDWHTRRQILDALQEAHYALWSWPAKTSLRDTFDARIERVVGRVADGAAEHAADVFERWDLQERQAKFICNAMRVYEQFGREWRLPLFDAELMDFWARVPVELRAGRALYFAFVRQRQALPVTPANKDRGALAQAAVRAMDALRLRPVAKRVRRAVRRLRWRQAYENAPLAWPALIAPEVYRRSYTGQETMHSFLARDYLNSLRMSELDHARSRESRPVSSKE